MINPKAFYELLERVGVEFFTGVPDSLLKDFCAYLADHSTKQNNIIAANEGGAVGLATGYYLATGKIPFVYMQNSGIGNAVNPLLSLVDSDVYGIPMLLMIGWRGEPGVKDEPQHVKQGKVSLELLDAMQIPYEIMPDEFDKCIGVITKAIDYCKEFNAPFALVVRKDTFESYKLENTIKTNFEMSREDAIKIIVDALDDDDIVVSTTGMASRELFEYREKLGHKHDQDFLTVGSMGHASQIALGIALNCSDRNVYCFDGDGSLLMHTGSMGIIGNLEPANFKHIVFNNGAHDSVGGQPTIGYDTNFVRIAESFNYKSFVKVQSLEDLKSELRILKSVKGPGFLEIYVNKGARKDLGRPTTTPQENKAALMKKITI